MKRVQRQFSHQTIATIVREQRIVLELVARLERDAGDMSKRRFLVHSVFAELAEHVAGSERLTYRVVRTLLHDGAEIAQQQFAERARTKHLMNQFDGLEATHPTFEPLVHAIVVRIRRQVLEEQSTILPRLVDALTPLSRVGRDTSERQVDYGVERRAG